MFSRKSGSTLDPSPATPGRRTDADVAGIHLPSLPHFDRRHHSHPSFCKLLKLVLTGLVLTGSSATSLRATEKLDIPVSALRTEYAFTAHVLVGAPISVGQGPQGLRRYVPITGGTVDGPLLRGKVLTGGGDSQVVRADGVLAIDAQYMIQTDDGVTVAVSNRGLRLGPAEVIARMARGEKVSPAEYYFRTAALFEAPLGSRYDWLNQAVFVAVAERHPDEAVVHFYRVL